MNAKVVANAQPHKAKNRTQWGLVWFRFKKNKLAMFGLFMIIILLLLCMSASLYIDYEDVYTQSMADRFISPGSEGHFLGTDQLGRDLFARIMYGGRISLQAGFCVVIIELILGVTMGGIAGYYGGKVDMIIMRLVEIFYCIPFLPLMLIVSSVTSAMKVAP